MSINAKNIFECCKNQKGILLMRGFYKNREERMRHMEKVITLLYDIEEKANRILNRATEEKAKLYQELNDKMEQMDAKMNEETQKKLEVLQVKFDKEVVSDTKGLIEANEKHLADIESKFRANHNYLVKQIFDQIIAE